MSKPLSNLELYEKIKQNDFTTWFEENKKRIEWRSIDFDKLFQNIKSITDENVAFNNLIELGSRLAFITSTYECKKSFPTELTKWRKFVCRLEELTIPKKDCLKKLYLNWLNS